MSIKIKSQRKETVKYIVHYISYYDWNFKDRTSTFRILDSAVKCLNANRAHFIECFRENDMRYYESGEKISPESLAFWASDDSFYIEKQIIVSERVEL